MRLLRELKSNLNRLFVFELFDQSRVEAVFYRGDTLCVSTQVGCAVGCPFCLSGAGGLQRNLSTEEITGQYELLKDHLPIRKIAFAGIGEPLMNWERVEAAFWHFKKKGLGVSFYTTGHPVSKLRRLLQLPHRGVTISVHAVSEDKRRILLPHAGKLQELLQTLKEVLKEFPKRKKKRVSLAYLLLKGVNDSEQDLKAFGELLRELGLSATLLRYNPTLDTYQDVQDVEYEKAFLLLRSYGVRVTLSTRFRKDRLGGCGTLTGSRVLTAC